MILETDSQEYYERVFDAYEEACAHAGRQLDFDDWYERNEHKFFEEHTTKDIYEEEES